jgi:putative spermidine/putrescine transport system ATP-binding protein
MTTSAVRLPAVRLRGVTKRFGDVVAVDRVDLDVESGEFFAMLGFELPSTGTIELDARDVSRDPPFDRDVNTVFQDYALFPHMSVIKNIEYGLRVKKVPKAECRRRAEAALAQVRLDGFAHRKPHQLSGGQRQRVALARALVNRPKVLLLDEPLGALDLKLREEMQVELKQIQHEVGITFIFVTHDQGEALSMSDRVAVFNEGRIEQVGSPQEIYENPATEFVAGFVGTANLLSDSAGQFTIRPERIDFVVPDDARGAGQIHVSGEVRDVQYLGSTTRYRVALRDGRTVIVDRPNRESLARAVIGDEVTVAWHTNDCRRVGDAAPTASKSIASTNITTTAEPAIT